MESKRKALEGQCLKIGYKFKVAKRYLDTKTLNSLSLLEKLWKSNRGKFVNDIPDQDIIQAYVAIRDGNNHRMSEQLRTTMENLDITN